MKNLVVITTISLSVLLFLISLFLPAFYTTEEGIPGGFALVMGWLNLLAIDQVGFGIICWLANLFLPLAWLGLIIPKFKPARIGSLVCAAAGLGLALCFLFMKQILISTSGSPTLITSIGVGFYLWIVSFAVCLIGAIVIAAQERKNER